MPLVSFSCSFVLFRVPYLFVKAKYILKYFSLVQVRWLMSIIPAFGRLRLVNHLRSGVRHQPGQHGETPSLLKIQNYPVWWCTPVVPVTWEAEAGELLEPKRQRLQ